MKKIKFYLGILATLLFFSCVEVVDVDLNTAPPKLVVEASINWKKGTTGNFQIITLSTTTDYYSNTIPKVSGATVTIKNSTNTIFNFVETSNKGEYVCVDFEPVINETYTLTIINNNETYTASEILKEVAPITRIEQKEQQGFIEIKTFFTDPVNETNYYLYKYTTAKNDIIFSTDEDLKFNGNEFFSFSDDVSFGSDDKIKISHCSISKSYYNYINIIINLDQTGGGLFETPSPGAIRGNIINTNNTDNYPLGYFSLSEVDDKIYIIK